MIHKCNRTVIEEAHDEYEILKEGSHYDVVFNRDANLIVVYAEQDKTRIITKEQYLDLFVREWIQCILRHMDGRW